MNNQNTTLIEEQHREQCKIRKWADKFNKEQREKALPKADELVEETE